MSFTYLNNETRLLCTENKYTYLKKNKQQAHVIILNYLMLSYSSI